MSPCIVMKFGGSSLASPFSVRRVVQIIKRETRPRIVVVSAHGDTTDRLVQIMKHAVRAETYLSWKAIKELREYHFALAEELLDEGALASVDAFLRQTFRDLHVKMLEICDGERELTQEDRAAVLSLGEQISSRLMAACLAARHLDARKLILTNENFCDAQPRYWETYARWRWALASSPAADVTVVGGFIAATEDGRTTVLGRGGSDLTATIAGAAMNADQIQIWKDVDGMLTCDPRLKAEGLKAEGLVVKFLSYREAAALAQAGAKILHPDTIAPAERLRIPIFLRNTFQPQSDGTQIGVPGQAADCIKSVVCQKGLMLLEISGSPDLAALAAEMQQQNTGVRILNCSAERLLLVADSRTDFSAWKMMETACLQVRTKAEQVLMTLVGTDAASSQQRVRQMLGDAACVAAGNGCVYAVLNECDLKRCLDLLHSQLFQEADPRVFARRTAATPTYHAPPRETPPSAERFLIANRREALG